MEWCIFFHFSSFASSGANLEGKRSRNQSRKCFFKRFRLIMAAVHCCLQSFSIVDYEVRHKCCNTCTSTGFSVLFSRESSTCLCCVEKLKRNFKFARDRQTGLTRRFPKLADAVEFSPLSCVIFWFIICCFWGHENEKKFLLGSQFLGMDNEILFLKSFFFGCSPSYHACESQKSFGIPFPLFLFMSCSFGDRGWPDDWRNLLEISADFWLMQRTKFW